MKEEIEQLKEEIKKLKEQIELLNELLKLHVKFREREDASISS